MDSVILTYKGTSAIHSMNVVAGFKAKDNTIFLVREGLNNSIYKIIDNQSSEIFFGLECSLRFTKKAIDSPCGEFFSFKGKKFLKLTRIELVDLFKDKIYQPIKLEKR